MAIGTFAEGESAALAVTVLRVRPDGPNVVSGDVVLVGAPAASKKPAVTIVLCRCGMSKDKPFCDGTHTRTGFKDPGILPEDAPLEALAPGRVTIRPTLNGPLECHGPLTLLGADGHMASRKEMCLCRCGHSQTKPFCDGSHKKVGFKA